MNRVTFSVFLASMALIPGFALGEPDPALESALEMQSEFVSQHPSDPGALSDLGNLLLLTGDPAGAEDAYLRALELQPELSAARFNLALLLQQQGSLRRARIQYRKVVKSDPDNAWALYQLGSIYEARGKKPKAVRSYSRAFVIDPDLSDPDANPSLIDNSLRTWAIVRAFSDTNSPALVPRTYTDPSRIAGLLIPEWDHDATEGEQELLPDEAADGYEDGPDPVEPSGSSQPRKRPRR